MHIFLTMKAWQLLMLFIAPALLFALGFSGLDSFKWFGILILFWAMIFFVWVYSIGSTSNRELMGDLRKDPTWYKLSFVIPILYIILLATVIFPSIQIDGQPQKPAAWMTKLHLISMCCVFYSLWFTAKQFVTLQRGVAVKFIDYSVPFFLLCFTPIGIWFLQPSINEVFDEENLDLV